ncbi:MAG: type VII toxin-antitoxin system MntA family adenylyltransferase antitoxin [Thermodesulfobacteriota bacterium]
MNTETHIIRPLRGYFQNRPDIRCAILFGSAARNRLVPGSDIDIAVAADQALSFQERINLIHEASRLISFDVDLVDLNAVSGLILKQAICTGIALKKDASTFARLLKKMLYDQTDMMPYTTMIRKKRLRDFIYG